MQPIASTISGCFQVFPRQFRDARGSFVKLVQSSAFHALGFSADFQEVFWSSSHAGVFRGLHFQRPPHDHDKLVSCMNGRATDYVLDLRPGPGYGTLQSFELEANVASFIYIPRGCAHGFLAREPSTILLYCVNSEYDSQADTGVSPFSPALGLQAIIGTGDVSDRDRALPLFDDAFESPF